MKTTLTVLALGIALAGCSANLPKAPANYPQLTVKADEDNTLLFAKQNLNLGSYNKVYIAPVRVQMTDDHGNRDVTDEEANKLAVYTEISLKKKMSQQHTLVNQPGPDVLTVRFLITELVPARKAQVAMSVPPFALINMTSPNGIFLGSITLAGELYEGLADQPSVAFVGTRMRPGTDPSLALGRWAVAEKIIDSAAERLATDLAKERALGR